VAAYAVALWLLLVPAITAWHRHVLLGPAAGPARGLYRFGRAEWLYVEKTVLLGALGLLVALALAVPAGVLAALADVAAGLGSLDMIGQPVVMTVLVAAALIMVPWALVLPAAALGRSLPLSGARAAGRGNRWRLIAVILLAYLPELVVSGLITRLALALLGDAAASTGGRAVLTVAPAIVEFAFLAVTVGALSFAYLRLEGARPGVTAPAAS